MQYQFHIKKNNFVVKLDFYFRKKRQMQKEHITEILEKKLFHGTRQNVVDPICRSNFDWRLCGLNGTVFGQGKFQHYHLLLRLLTAQV